jgi:SNF2 family DNA or RNA helicase
LTNQKGTALVGGALTDETLASSKSILTKTTYGGQKGLQQFYSPDGLATLVRRIVGIRVNVLDPTAGDGSLLRMIDPNHAFGVEIDADQIRNAENGYNAINGDIQHVYPLLRMGMPGWDAIAANPPFGLQWSDPTIREGKETNSAVVTFLYAARLLSHDGQLIFVCGRDRFYRQIANLPEAAGIYAVVECDDLFEGTTIPCVVAFGINPGIRSGASTGYETRQFPLDMLDLASAWVEELRAKALGPYNSVATQTYSYGTPTPRDKFKAIETEYKRRAEKRLKKNREFDLLLVGSSLIQWLPSTFATMALRNVEEAYTFNGLNGQPLNYFANDERLWNKLVKLKDQGVVTIEPRLYDAVEELLTTARKEICPLYDIKPQQRLGYLTDVDFITCKVDGPEHGFVAGEDYRLDTRSKTIIETDERLVESKKNPGEYEMRTFEKQRKVLSVNVGRWMFYDSGADASENIQYLIDHFELPDPGQVGTRHPDEIDALVTLANEVLDDFEANSRKYEAKHPELTPFSRREFQIQDIARLAFKGSGLLSWEQGLGKTLGGLLFAEMMVRLGAQDARMVVAPGDLIPQWEREIERFHGIKPQILKAKPSFYWESGEDGKLKKKTTTGVHGQAVDLAQRLANPAEKAFVLTYYEALTMVGMRGRNKPLPPIAVEEKIEQRLKKGTNRSGYYYFDDDVRHNDLYVDEADAPENAIREDNSGLIRRVQVPCKGYYDTTVPLYSDGSKRAPTYGYIPAVWEEYTVKITSREVCPECRADTRSGWNGMFCEAELVDGSKCGYAHVASKIRPAVSYMSGAFKRGVVLMDEGTLIQGEFSKRSIAMRGLRAQHKLLLTGTPIKNFIGQAFWLLWWCLGNGSKRFGYNYEGGHTKFENNFSVVEWSKSGSRRENRKVLPEVTNLSLLWRLLSSSVIRRRKEETGEYLVPKFYHEIHVPMGMAQAELMDTMLKNFPALFAEKYPESKLVAAGMHTIMAPLIGLNAKLDYAATLPEADPDVEWWGVHGVSNWTPAGFRTVELAMALAKEGRKVLIGSNLVATSKWIADRLNEKGVDAIHILDEDGTTTNKDKRAQRVHAFQTDDHQVFCAGVKAIRLGHNLDRANAVIMHGLDWDYETLDQFIARIHRLTSQRPVDVYVVIPKLDGQETITSRKWGILGMKGAAAQLALDGRLIEKNEEEIDKAQIIRELMERGITVTDEAVDEVTVQEAWDALPEFEHYVAPEGLIPPTPVIEEGSCDSAQAESTPSLAGSEAPDLDDGIVTALEKALFGHLIVSHEAVAEKVAELDAEAEAAEAELEAELAAIEAIYDPEAAVPLPFVAKGVVQYDQPIGPRDERLLQFEPEAEPVVDTSSHDDVSPPTDLVIEEVELPSEEELTAADPYAGFTISKAFIVPTEDGYVAVPQDEPVAETVPDELVLAQNDAEMPVDMTAVMEQMAKMQEQLAALARKNEELEARLSQPEQLSFDLEGVA